MAREPPGRTSFKGSNHPNLAPRRPKMRNAIAVGSGVAIWAILPGCVEHYPGQQENSGIPVPDDRHAALSGGFTSEPVCKYD